MPDTPGRFKIVFEIWPPNSKPGQPGVVRLDRAETEFFERS
jgi:hypothetical protein